MKWSRVVSWVQLILVLLWVGEIWAMDAAELDRRYAEIERVSGENASISYMNASAPIGRILLIRKGKDLCVVRFTEYHRGRDAKPPTVFDSGEETLLAEYDWHHMGDSPEKLQNQNMKSVKPQLRCKRDQA